MSEYNVLRKFLSPAIKGPNTDAVLESFAAGTEHLIYNVEAVNEQMFISTASAQYLDSLLASKNLTRPPEIGLADDIFRKLGVAVTKTKQIRDQIHQVVKIMYGYEYIQAYIDSDFYEPFALEDGDTLVFSFDGQESITTTFVETDFQNINIATAQEIADAITKSIKNQGKKGSSVVRNEGAGNKVAIISNTMGSSSSVSVLGGKAQNILKFPSIRTTSGQPTTQWTLSSSPTGNVRLMWTGGPNPRLGRVKKNDYINIYGDSFSEQNKGTFTIDKVQGGEVNQAYVEFKNPIFVGETKLQGTEDGILFFYPKKRKTDSNLMYSSVYQTQKRVLSIYLPATTKVVRRERKGAMHVQPTENTGVLGPYVYDTSKPYTIGVSNGNLTQPISGSTETVVSLDDSSGFPDEQGFVVFNFGYKNEEGPVPYLARPSDSSILISPSYKFKNRHEIGENCSLIYETSPHKIQTSGVDMAAYLTDVASGRTYTQTLIDSITATGIVLNFIILYPNDIGLGKNGTKYSEKYTIWGA